MIQKLKTYLIVILASISVVFYAYIKIQQNVNQRQEDVTVTLEKNTLRVVDIANNLLVEKFRDKNGKVTVKRKYLPSEGKVTVTQTIDGKVTVKVKSFGLCFKPGIALSWYRQPAKSRLGTEIVPAVMFSPKFAYAGRLGLIACVNHKTVGVGISRHMDDMFWIWRPQNLELFLSYHPITFDDVVLVGSQKWFIGLRGNF